MRGFPRPNRTPKSDPLPQSAAVGEVVFGHVVGVVGIEGGQRDRVVDPSLGAATGSLRASGGVSQLCACGFDMDHYLCDHIGVVGEHVVGLAHVDGQVEELWHLLVAAAAPSVALGQVEFPGAHSDGFEG